MRSQKIGYARVSTLDQNLDRQLDLLRSHGVEKIYTEKMTSTKRDRPELNKLLERMEEGDTVVIKSLSRLGAVQRISSSWWRCLDRRGWSW